MFSHQKKNSGISSTIFLLPKWKFEPKSKVSKQTQYTLLISNHGYQQDYNFIHSMLIQKKLPNAKVPTSILEHQPQTHKFWFQSLKFIFNSALAIHIKKKINLISKCMLSSTFGRVQIDSGGVELILTCLVSLE